MKGASLPRAAARAFSSFRRHRMTDHGAGLAYYLAMSLFPGMLVAISLLGLLGQATTVTDAAGYLRRAGVPPEVIQPVESSLRDLVQSSASKASVALALGVALGLNSASGAFGAAGRALNVAFAVEEDRGFVRRKAVDLAATLVIILLAIVALVALLLGGRVAHDLFGTIGLGETAATIWSVMRWPVALVAMLLVFAIVYDIAPDRRERPFRWITPGAVAAVVVWIAASLVLVLYISHVTSFGATYGAFAGAIVLLLWLYITALALLLGGELNAEIERAKLAGRDGPPFPSPPPAAAS